jgi:hypothetical protein
METKVEKLKGLASDTARAASRGLTSARDVASKAGSDALAVGKSAQQAIGNALEHEDTEAAVARARELSISAAVEARKLADRVSDKVKAADANHKEIAEKVESVSMGLGIASGVAAAGAALAAPTGLGAVGVALGITSAPLIVTAAPVIGVAATVTGVVSGGAYFYSKWKAKKRSDGETH